MQSDDTNNVFVVTFLGLLGHRGEQHWANAAAGGKKKKMRKNKKKAHHSSDGKKFYNIIILF